MYDRSSSFFLRHRGLKRHLLHIDGGGRETGRGGAHAGHESPRAAAQTTRRAGRENLLPPPSTSPMTTARRRITPPPATATATAAAVAAVLQLPMLLAVLHLGASPGPAAGELRPQSELTSACFDFPAKNFDPKNCIKAINDGHTPYLPMNVGDNAIDFTLHDLRGEPWNLADTLSRTDAPVVMIWGMYTCPAFQGYDMTPPWDMDSYAAEHSLVELYKDRATFVHMYGPEPHPKVLGTNFDKGSVWPHYWSVVSQARSYEERVDMANRITQVIHRDQVILPDYLPGNPYSDLVQPVWCSYAMGARPVTVVDPSGTLYFQRAWFHPAHVGRAIDKNWCARLDEVTMTNSDRMTEEGEGNEGGVRGQSTINHENVFAALNCTEDVIAEIEDVDWWNGTPPLF